MSNDCNNSQTLKLVKKILKSAKENSSTNITPISKSEIKNIENAIDEYYQDCKICESRAKSDYKCFNLADEKLVRAMPFMRKNIYPWRNFDWDYANFVDNNYSVLATGASKSGNLESLFKNMKAFIKLNKGYLFEGNPSSSSKPGKLGRDSDIPYYECIESPIDSDGNKINNSRLKSSCLARRDVKYRKEERPPTDDSFLKKYKVDGENSSSYYVKVGTCPRNKIKSKSVCERKGFDWIPNPVDKIMNQFSPDSRTDTVSGSCHQPRYAFLNNSPGYTIAGIKQKGLIPSLAKDFLSLSPDKILASLQGRNIEDLYIVQKCDKETFKNYNKTSYNLINIVICLLIILFILGILSKIISK